MRTEVLSASYLYFISGIGVSLAVSMLAGGTQAGPVASECLRVVTAGLWLVAAAGFMLAGAALEEVENEYWFRRDPGLKEDSRIKLVRTVLDEDHEWRRRRIRNRMAVASLAAIGAIAIAVGSLL